MRVGLVCALLLLAGCAQPGGHEQAGSAESATYELRLRNNRTDVTMTVVAEEEVVRTSTTLPVESTAFPPSRTIVNVTADRALRAVHIESLDVVLDPIGAWLEGPQFAAMLGIGQPDPLAFWMPVAWWDTPKSGEQTSSSGVSWDWRLEGDEKTLTWTTPCVIRCVGAGAADGAQLLSWSSLTLVVSGPRDELLPREIRFQAEGVKDAVAIRLSHANIEPASLDFPPLMKPPNTDKQALCGFAPCEPDGWPLNLSIQTGLDLLMSSPEWATYDSGGQAIRPVSLWVYAGWTEPSVLDQEVMSIEHMQWGFTFMKEGTVDVAYFQLLAPKATLGLGATAISFDPSWYTLNTAYYDEAWDEEVHELTELLRRAGYVLGSGQETARFEGLLRISYDSLIDVPSDGLRLRFSLEQFPACTSVVVSMTEGVRLLSWQYC